MMSTLSLLVQEFFGAASTIIHVCTALIFWFRMFSRLLKKLSRMELHRLNLLSLSLCSQLSSLSPFLRIPQRLEIIQKPYGNFVNVDTTTPLGLKRAKTLGLAPSRVADVVFTPYIHETTILFDMDHRGRFFTVLRDPVSRMQSLYYFRRMNGSLGDKTLEEFIRTAGENWMVRTLTDSMSGRIDVAMLDVAKEILRRKFLVGLFDEKTETLRRIELFFGWKFSSPVSQSCKNQLYYFEWLSHNPHPELEPDNPLTVLIQRQNRYDMELYEYAIQLFQEQEQLFWGGDEEEDGGQIVNQIGGIM